MTEQYVLYLKPLVNGDHEIHKAGCTHFPASDFDELGYYRGCLAAVTEARRKHPGLKVNACGVCAGVCRLG